MVTSRYAGCISCASSGNISIIVMSQRSEPLSTRTPNIVALIGRASGPRWNASLRCTRIGEPIFRSPTADAARTLPSTTRAAAIAGSRCAFRSRSSSSPSHSGSAIASVFRSGTCPRAGDERTDPNASTTRMARKTDGI